MHKSISILKLANKKLSLSLSRARTHSLYIHIKNILKKTQRELPLLLLSFAYSTHTHTHTRFQCFCSPDMMPAYLNTKELKREMSKSIVERKKSSTIPKTSFPSSLRRKKRRRRREDFISNELEYCCYSSHLEKHR